MIGKRERGTSRRIISFRERTDLLRAMCSLILFGFSFTVILAGQAEEDVAPVKQPTPNDIDGLRQSVVSESPIDDSDREHWAFRPIERPEIPKALSFRSRNAIDAMVFSALQKTGLDPAPEADRATLARRVSFDLTGLPPSPEELAEFLESQSPDALERFVDRLLASPDFGVRWGQYWLDLARFAETDGFEHDKVRGDAWRFRDWVIGAMNADLPYDQFISEQIAGDELAIASNDSSVATMFCLSGSDMPDMNDQVERRHIMLNEMTSTVGAVLLGLQIGCAECHDHKSDPISQADFYRLRAVFESSVPPLKRDTPYLRLKNQKEVEPARLWIKGDHRRPGPRVAPAFPRIADIADRRTSTDPNKLGSAITPRLEFSKWLFSSVNPLTSRVIVNRVWQHHLGRGIFDTPSDVGLLNAEPTHPELLDWLAKDLLSNGWSLKQLHRRIVESATYRQASRLDVGAGNTSQAADWNKRLQLDPSNRWFSRGSRRRLEGEAIRDSMLFLAGLLADEQGGPGVMPPLPAELVGTLLKGQWTTSPREADHHRRSIYLFARRNLRYPLFEAFDRPEANSSCPQRNRSTTAPQSLILLNSEFSLSIARHLAGRLIDDCRERTHQIELLYQRAFSRPPTDAEHERLANFLIAESKRLQSQSRSMKELALPIGTTVMDGSRAFEGAALVEACLAMLNASEMIYVD